MSSSPCGGSTVRDVLSTYALALEAALISVQPSIIASIVAVLKDGRHRGSTVWLAGNGGSAANAAHCALHLQQAGLRVVDLGANVPLLTAYSNDCGYARCFVEQVSPREGDMVGVFSCSGQSPNILELLGAEAVQHRCTRFGFLGCGGGKAAALCHFAVALPETRYGLIEDAHSALLHILQGALV